MKTRKRILSAAFGLALGGLFVVPAGAAEPAGIADATASTYKLAISGMT